MDQDHQRYSKRVYSLQILPTTHGNNYDQASKPAKVLTDQTLTGLTAQIYKSDKTSELARPNSAIITVTLAEPG